MEQIATQKITYGLYLLSTKAEGKENGCIIDTCMQVAYDPVRIAVSVMNGNLTCDLIKKSGKFTLSILNTECTMDTIRRFGYQSGRDCDKFADIPAPKDKNEIPYLGYHSCAMLSAKVMEQRDLGTHSLFLAEVEDMKLLNDTTELTYAEYYRRMKENT